MKETTPSRVRYFERQYLRRQDFADEQGYQLAVSRRHNITHHSWGIVMGLEIALEEGNLVVRPGLAIDGYGRELLLRFRKPILTEEFQHLGSDRLDVWLYYESNSGTPAQSGFLACGETEDTNYCFNETPRVELKRATSSRITKPDGVSDALLNTSSQLDTSDDALKRWPIHLGRITYLPQEKEPANQFLVDLSDRRYAGVVADVIDHPATEMRIQLGAMSEALERKVDNKRYVYQTGKGRVFGLFVPGLDEVDPHRDKIKLDPRFAIDAEYNTLRGTTRVYGNLLLPGGAVQFGKSEVANEVARENSSIYRFIKVDVETKEEVADELRIDLGKFDDTKPRKFVIGFTAEDGTFTPSITLEYSRPADGAKFRPLLTVEGDLKLNGLVDCQHLINRSLSNEAISALLASFQAGVGAAGGS